MPVTGAAVAYAAIGGLIAYSGVKGASLSDTVKAVLAGNLDLKNTEPVSSPVPISPSSPSSPSGPAGKGGTPATNQAIARLLTANYGWNTGTEWDDLVLLWTQESGWNNKAKNPQSGAYGIAQALPESKYPYAGTEAGGSDATAQIRWGLDYIQGRYGSPSAAWAHEQSYNWY